MPSVASPFLLLALLQLPAPDRVVVIPKTLQLEVGESHLFSAAAYDGEGKIVTGLESRWLTTTEEILSVDSMGKVTALRPGGGRVVAMMGGTVGFADVVVPQLPPSEIELLLPEGSRPELLAGTSVPLATVARTRLGDVLENPEVRFASDAPSVAGVDALGRIFGRGAGEATISARAGQARATIAIRVLDGEGIDYRLSREEAAVRTGEVVRFRVEARGRGGASLPAVYPAWSVGGSGAEVEAEGGEGVFVAEEPGRYRVSALVGEGVSLNATVEVRPREFESQLIEIGRGPISTHHSGDMWAFEGADGRDYAYIGTFMHDWMKAWDVTDPGNPQLTDSLRLDARRINDVKIHPNNRIGIVTREGASDRENGIVLLDLGDPAHPSILSEYKKTVTGGVHNVWIDGTHDLVYACHNGTSDLHIIDISDARSPKEVGRWGLEKKGKTLHDVIVQDGYAYLSYWDDGIVMLDAGAGTHGGTPSQPTFVSQFKYPIGNTHVAWRHGRYLFVGDEIFPGDWNADRPIEARGYIHVVDYSDPENPKEVARYEVPEAGVHNVWAEGDLLYIGYYQAGLRIVDISGELRGDLYRQGREVARLITTDENTTVPHWAMTWGAQLFKGNIFSSDLNSGLWITKLMAGSATVF